MAKRRPRKRRIKPRRKVTRRGRVRVKGHTRNGKRISPYTRCAPRRRRRS